MPDEYNEPWVTELMEEYDRINDTNLKKIIKLKDSHIPSKLYRYRKIEDRELNTLIGEYFESIGKKSHVIWLSNPLYFKDPDTVFALSDDITKKVFIARSLREYIYNYNEGEKIDKLIDEMNQGGDDINYDQIDQLFWYVAIKHHDKLSEKHYYELTHPEIWKIENFKDEIRRKIFGELAIGCFSVTNTSDFLWGKFTKNKGMCLEYDMTRCTYNNLYPKDSDLQRFKLYPVCYSDRLRDITNLLLANKEIKQKSWTARLTPIVLTKKTKFHEEHEWRLVMDNFAFDKKGDTFPFIKPSTIYLGVKVTKKNCKKVRKIAEPLGIRLVQLHKGAQNDTYSEETLYDPPDELNRLRVNPITDI